MSPSIETREGLRMKRLVIDIDDTLCKTTDGKYSKSEVILSIRDQLVSYRNSGFEIVLYTSRNMRTYASNLGKINANTLPTLVTWLNENDIPYDEIYVGKPWCGHEGFYVDDKAVRPDEFAILSYDEIQDLLRAASKRLKDHTVS